MSLSATKKVRDSNMELLRVVAMLLIMVVHANFRALPKPDAAAIAAAPTSAFLQFMSEGFTIVGVDVFVMLSGWYGIRPRLSRLSEMLFQVIFFGLVCLGIAFLISGQLPQRALLTVLMLNEGDYWFVKTYIALYLFAPVLNSFAENATKQQQELVLTGVFAFMFLFGWLFQSSAWILSGYSLPWFMCLYLLARYMHIHQPWFTRFHWKVDLLLYLTVAAFLTIVVFVMRHYNLGGLLYFYNSPVVVVGAMYLLLFFSKLSFHSRFVNWLGISVLSVYLTHSSSFLAQYYDGAVRQWFYGETLLTFLFNVSLLIIVVFFASILMDKIRLLLWQQLKSIRLSNKKNKDQDQFILL